ncbi:MAG: O-acetyl-ADP-ribose deacetylase [Nitrospirae bacterium]|nr:O-acetyl-ADP-ribose deacetylase [Nitrospirota bacterium]
MSGVIEVIIDDITQMNVDAIVNAANESLLGGGGVDGAIHSAAGPGLLDECRRLGGCPTGEARLTGGHNLPARFVIHTVGPIWKGGASGEDDLLASCYSNCMMLAAENGVRSIAFPSVSTGVYRFPVERASKIAVREVRFLLEKYPEIERAVFVCFGRNVYDAYMEAMKA